MRLLVLSNHYPPHSIGSYELQCCQACQELSHRGHQIAVLTSVTPAEARSNFVPNERVHRELALFDEVPDADSRFHRLFKTVRKNRAILRNHLEQWRPDAALVWGMDRLPTSLLQFLEETGTPVVYVVQDHWMGDSYENDHWCRYWRDEGSLSEPAAKTLLRAFRLETFVKRQAAPAGVESLKLNNICFCSQSLKDQTSLACGRGLEHALIIPCAISPQSIRQKEGLAAFSYRLLFAGRLVEKKDPITALRAVQELRHRGDDRFTLDIFGRGRPEFEASLHDYVRRFQLGGAVSFKPVAEEQVRNNIHLYDALLFTSKYPEPFPLIHLKAMAARVPVISTLEGGCAELIRDGENALAFETGNHHQLADKIAHIANDTEMALRLAKTAHDEVIQNYGLSRIVSRMESLLHRAVQRDSGLKEAV